MSAILIKGELTMRDKRKFPRLKNEWQLTYRVLEEDRFLNDPIRQFTVNISGGGICFTSHEELKPNTMVALELESDQFTSPILAMAKVVWSKRARDGYEVGAEFWWIGWQNNDAQQAIASYIATETK
jgi:c-di-GMP-binding flagellar brake protein YcgR